MRTAGLGITWPKWTILTLATFWAFLTNLQLRNHFRTSNNAPLAATTIGMMQTLSVLGVLALHASPFHLLWLIPLTYVTPFFTLNFKRLRFLTQAYGYFIAYTIPSHR